MCRCVDAALELEKLIASLRSSTSLRPAHPCLSACMYVSCIDIIFREGSLCVYIPHSLFLASATRTRSSLNRRASERAYKGRSEWYSWTWRAHDICACILGRRGWDCDLSLTSWRVKESASIDGDASGGELASCEHGDGVGTRSLVECCL